MSKYILSIDQSTQGTKALLFDEKGALLRRADISHRQIINDLGWVEHDPEEIMRNTLQVVKDVAAKAGIDKNEIAALGVSNQRETSVAWDRASGKPVYNAIVWQCARGKAITEQLAAQGYADEIKKRRDCSSRPTFRRQSWHGSCRMSRAYRSARSAEKSAWVRSIAGWSTI